VKHGVPCLAACKNCNGEMCENAGESPDVDDSDILDCEVSVEETVTEHDPDTFLVDLLLFDTL
jgi:hypothetical protein